MNRFCPACGAPRATPEQRFCGSCGAMLDAGPPPMTPPMTPPMPVAAPATAPPAWQPPPDYAVPLQQAPFQQTPGQRRLPLGPVVASAAAVLALVAAGLVGWQVLRPEGGADSPEDAVLQLVTASARQDPVAALEMVSPAEVDGLDDLYRSAYDRAANEGLTGADRLTDALDVRIEGLTFDVDELSDSAARVVMTGGTYAVTFEPDRLPDRLRFITDEYPDGRTWSGDILDDVGDELPDVDWENDRPEPFLDTVRVDGRWYVSLLGTYVDLLFGVPTDSELLELDDLDVRGPDYDAIDEEVPEPVVAERPEDVLDNLAAAVSSEDVSEVLANFPADQMAAMRPWAGTLEDAVDSTYLDLDLSVSDVDSEVDDQGDLVRLTLDGGSVTVRYADDDEAGQAQGVLDGRCVEGYDDSGDRERLCLGGVVSQVGVDEFFLMLREVGGGYQIDPMATAIAYGRQVVERAPASLVDDAIEEICRDVDDEAEC